MAEKAEMKITLFITKKYDLATGRLTNKLVTTDRKSWVSFRQPVVKVIDASGCMTVETSGSYLYVTQTVAIDWDAIEKLTEGTEE